MPRLHHALIHCFSGLLLLTLAAAPASAQEEVLTLNEAPQPIRETIKRELGANSFVEEILREKDEGEYTYEVNGENADGLEVELEISENGTVLRKEQEVEEADLPENILAAVKKAAREATFDDAKRETRPDGTIYEVDLDGVTGGIELTIAGNGTLLKREDEVEASALPAAVREAMKKRLGDAFIDNIKRIVRYGRKPLYEIGAEVAGDEVDLEITEDGTILD